MSVGWTLAKYMVVHTYNGTVCTMKKEEAALNVLVFIEKAKLYSVRMHHLCKNNSLHFHAYMLVYE